MTLALPALAQTPPADIAAVRGETPRPYVMGQDATHELRAAVEASRHDGKTVLVVFGGNWCIWCRRLDYEFHHDPVIAPEITQHFRVIHVDQAANRALDARWGTPSRFGLPVIVVLNAQGEPSLTQNTGDLELGPGHSRTRVMAFLRRARPT